MSHSLAGFHLLVTRPTAQAQAWAAQLQGLGAQVTQEPMLVIEPLSDSGQDSDKTLLETAKQHVLQLDSYQKLLFVSQNAVENFMPWLDQYWPQLPVGLDFFAIGASTAKQLQISLNQLDTVAGGHTDSAMNSEALLNLPALQAVNGEKIAIVRGVGGRTLLGDTLSQRGATVDSIAVYRRVAPMISDWHNVKDFINDPKTDHKIIVTHSAETIENLCKLTPQYLLNKLKTLPLLVPGKRVCDYGHQKGFNTIITAHNATHASMIEALYDWQQRQTQ